MFSLRELSDVSLLVARLARNQMLLVRSSPLEHSPLAGPSAMSDTTEPQASQQSQQQHSQQQHSLELLSQIHRHLVHRCIDDAFPELLYEYLDFWRYHGFTVQYMFNKMPTQNAEHGGIMIT